MDSLEQIFLDYFKALVDQTDAFLRLADWKSPRRRLPLTVVAVVEDE